MHWPLGGPPEKLTWEPFAQIFNFSLLSFVALKVRISPDRALHLALAELVFFALVNATLIARDGWSRFYVMEYVTSNDGLVAFVGGIGLRLLLIPLVVWNAKAAREGESN